MTEERTEAVQNVVDRVVSYQETAPEGTVADELRKGFAEAGVDVEEHHVMALADAIEAKDGPVDAGSVLSA